MDARDKILETATRLFSTKGTGYVAVSGGREARVSKALIFWHFENKERLFQSALQRSLEPYFVNVVGQLDGLDESRQINRLIDLFYEFVREHMQSIRFVLSLILRRRSSRTIRWLASPVFRIFRNLLIDILEWAPQGVFHPTSIRPRGISDHVRVGGRARPTFHRQRFLRRERERRRSFEASPAGALAPAYAVMRDCCTRQAGWGAIGMIISMLIVLVLVMIYLKGAGSESAKGGPPTAALEATKQRAHEFEEQQKGTSRMFSASSRVAGQPPNEWLQLCSDGEDRTPLSEHARREESPDSQGQDGR